MLQNMTITQKVVLATIVSIVCSFILLMVLVIFRVGYLVSEQKMMEFQTTSTMLAQNIAGGVRWGKDTIIQKDIEIYHEAASSANLKAVVAVKGKDIEVYKEGDESLLANTATIFSDFHRNFDGEASSFKSEGHQYIITPVYAGKNLDQYVGAALFVWDLSDALEAQMNLLFTIGIVVAIVVLGFSGLTLILLNKLLRTPVSAFAENINNILKNVIDKTKQINDVMDELRNKSEATRGKAGSVRDMSASTAESIQSVAAAANEMSSSVGEITNSVETVASHINNVSKKAENTNMAIIDLESSSTEITQVVALINDVADQINLLALNAAIEAARAGDAGRGFAVVADEVKKLSSQTANATDSIRDKISSMQSTAQNSVQAIKEITEAIDEVKVHSDSIARAMSEQNNTTNEITNSMNEAKGMVDSVDQQVTEVASDAEEAEHNTGLVEHSITELSVRAEELRKGIALFTKRI